MNSGGPRCNLQATSCGVAGIQWGENAETRAEQTHRKWAGIQFEKRFSAGQQDRAKPHFQDGRMEPAKAVF